MEWLALGIFGALYALYALVGLVEWIWVKKLSGKRNAELGTGNAEEERKRSICRMLDLQKAIRF